MSLMLLFTLADSVDFLLFISIFLFAMAASPRKEALGSGRLSMALPDTLRLLSRTDARTELLSGLTDCRTAESADMARTKFPGDCLK